MRPLPCARISLKGIFQILLVLSLLLVAACGDDDPVTPGESVSAPAAPGGEVELCKNETASYNTTGGVCSEGHAVSEYLFDWGDETESDWGAGTVDHAWTEAGEYCVKAKARCSQGVVSDWSVCLTVTVATCHVVTAPLIPVGDSPLCGNQSGSYTTSGGVCSEGHEVSEYWFDWDDASETEWTDGNSGHAWESVGIYCVRAKAKCSEGVESGYSACLGVSVAECGPTADFSGDQLSGVAPLLVQFTDLSDPGSSPVTGWSWNFGDGSTSDEANPAHEYLIGGAFTVTLTIATAIGSDAEIKENYVMVNRHPLQPSVPTPENNAEEVGTVDLQFGWKGTDPDGDNITYQVHFGTSSPPPMIDQTFNVTSYKLDYPLFNDTVYYWKIDAIDDGTPSLETEGEIWSFRTETTSTALLYATGADTYANSLLPEQNFCSSVNLYVGNGTEGYRSYLNFDLASIPSGAVIVDGGWKLYVYQWQVFGPVSPDEQYILYRNLENWSECSLTWTGRPGEDDTSSHVQDVIDLEPTWLVLEDPGVLSPDWLQALRDMISGQLPNYGFQLWSDCAPGTYFNFYTSNYAESEQQPRLEITYSWLE